MEQSKKTVCEKQMEMIIQK